jgi:hypothetical protein
MDNRAGSGNIIGLERVHEILLSANVAFAATFALVAFLYNGGGSGASSTALYYLIPGQRLFSYCSVAVNRLMHFDSWSGAGAEITFTALTVVASTVILFALRAIGRITSIGVILNPVGGILSLSIVPAFWLYALRASWLGDAAIYSFWKGAQWSFFEVEVPAVCAFFFLTRTLRTARWLGILVLVVHYTWWTNLVWSGAKMPLWSPRLLFVVFPCSGLVWLAYLNRHLPRKAIASPMSVHM